MLVVPSWTPHGTCEKPGGKGNAKAGGHEKTHVAHMSELRLMKDARDESDASRQKDAAENQCSESYRHAGSKEIDHFGSAQTIGLEQIFEFFRPSMMYARDGDFRTSTV